MEALQEERKEIAKKAFDRLITQLGQSEHATTQLLLLQQAINQWLTYLNYIPGIALDEADTGAKSEGKHRKLLIEAEQSLLQQNSIPITEDELLEAINGLLDIKLVQNLNDELQSEMAQHHVYVITKTYPNVVQKIGIKKIKDELNEAIFGTRELDVLLKQAYDDRDKVDEEKDEENEVDEKFTKKRGTKSTKQSSSKRIKHSKAK